MGLRDILLTPIYLLAIYFIAYQIRAKYYSHSKLKKFFMPTLSVKIIGAILAGLVYQFYYSGGDTFTYFNGAALIFEAFQDSFFTGLKLIMLNIDSYIRHPEVYQYTSQNWFFKDPDSAFVTKVTGILNLFSFNTYTVTAVIYAFFAFTANWVLYITFVTLYPKYYKSLAVLILFIPSVIFWGSGIFKDTLSFMALGWLFYSCFNIFIERNKVIKFSLLAVFSAYLLLNIKIYLLLAFIPGLLFWVMFKYKNQIRHAFLRKMMVPLFIVLTVVISYSVFIQIGKQYKQYAMQNLLYTAQVMQQWHHYVSKRDQGSGYTLGKVEPTSWGLMKKVPAAINVALFRPYPWEVKNPFMLVASVESTAILLLTLYVFFKARPRKFFILPFKVPLIFFCLFLGLNLAFGVGFTSYNFGALVRYKIPALPFYVTGIWLIYLHSKERKKELQQASAEY